MKTENAIFLLFGNFCTGFFIDSSFEFENLIHLKPNAFIDGALDGFVEHANNGQIVCVTLTTRKTLYTDFKEIFVEP